MATYYVEALAQFDDVQVLAQVLHLYPQDVYPDAVIADSVVGSVSVVPPGIWCGVDSVVGMSSVGSPEVGQSRGVDSVVNVSIIEPVRVLTSFKPRPVHTKVFLTELGDLNLKNRVTGLNGEKTEDANTFSLSMAGAAQIASAISERIEDWMTVYIAYRNNETGEVDFKEAILKGKIVDMSPHTGGRNDTLLVNCRTLVDYAASSAVTHTLDGVEYFKGGARPSARLPVRFGVLVGDTVVVGGSSFKVNKVSYNIDSFSRLMTVSGV